MMRQIRPLDEMRKLLVDVQRSGDLQWHTGHAAIPLLLGVLFRLARREARVHGTRPSWRYYVRVGPAVVRG